MRPPPAAPGTYQVTFSIQVADVAIAITPNKVILKKIWSVVWVIVCIVNFADAIANIWQVVSG